MLLVVVLVIITIVVLEGLVKIPLEPYSLAMVTFLGRPTGKVKKPGWRFLLLYPFLFGFELINAEKKSSSEKEIPVQMLRAPDRAEISFKVELTFIPDEKNLLNYIRAGKEAGVWKILRGIVQEKLRQFVTSSEEGPQTGEKMLEAGVDCVAVVLKAIAGEELDPIPSDIPTMILLHYFQKPQPVPLPEEIRIAGENWQKINNYMKSITSKQREEIKTAIEERRKVIKNISAGNGKQSLPHLGIIITRLNIAEINPQGEFAKALELKAKEVQERKGEVYEVETDIEKAEMLKRKVEEFRGEITLLEAYQVILTWKATREGHGFAFPGGEIPIGKLAGKYLSDKI